MSPGGDVDVEAWLGSLPDNLRPQRDLIEGLLGWCSAEHEVAWLVIGCSFARGNADALSDLDLGMGIRDGRLEAVLPSVVTAVVRLGEIVECYEHQIRDLCSPHRRVFAQYADRTQIDLVVLPASPRTFTNCVVLYDPDAVVTATPAARLGPDGRSGGAPAGDQVRIWACLAWSALANMAKYLRRSSLWEARDCLETARAGLLQLWATAEAVPEPQYGLTSILDCDAGELPPDLAATVAAVDYGELAAAGRQLATGLDAVQARLRESGWTDLPEALARFVTEDASTLPPPQLGR